MHTRHNCRAKPPSIEHMENGGGIAEELFLIFLPPSTISKPHVEMLNNMADTISSVHIIRAELVREEGQDPSSVLRSSVLSVGDE